MVRLLSVHLVTLVVLAVLAACPSDPSAPDEPPLDGNDDASDASCFDDLDCQLSAAECTVDDDCPADCDSDATPCPPESVLAPRCVAHRGSGRCAVAPSASGACRQAEDIEDIDIVVAVVTTDGLNVDVCAENGFCAEPGTSQAGCFQ